MLRAVLWTLRQRRYAALAIAGLVLALICIGAGTFEMHRFHEKQHDNDLLTANAHHAPVPLTTLVPLTGHGPAPRAFDIRYRPVTATGQFDPSAERYLGDQTQDGRQGFYVVTPLRTAAGALLVVRGFVPATPEATRPAQVAAAPTGTVTVRGWLQTASTRDDQLGRLGHGEITTINPREEAARLGTPTFQAYMTLDAHQPGTSGLAAVPPPDLSNPSGGAPEWQLFSYIIQWYAFAGLALALPFFLSRYEVREARRRFLGIDPGAMDFDAALDDDAAELPALPAGNPAALAVRASGELSRRGETPEQRWERAARLADRYGRSLGELTPAQGVAMARAQAARAAARPIVHNSAQAAHRSEDAYHGSYNDYLWELALADGNLPEVLTPQAEADPRDAGRPDPAPRVIESGPVDDGPPDAQVP